MLQIQVNGHMYNSFEEAINGTPFGKKETRGELIVRDQRSGENFFQFYVLNTNYDLALTILQEVFKSAPERITDSYIQAKLDQIETLVCEAMIECMDNYNPFTPMTIVVILETKLA